MSTVRNVSRSRFRFFSRRWTSFASKSMSSTRARKSSLRRAPVWAAVTSSG